MNGPKIRFPKNFFWGASTSAHQIEGGNINDWSVWEGQSANRLAAEAQEKFKEVPAWDEIAAAASSPDNYISGPAADHYNRYKEDIALAQSLGLNAFRFSLEWSRLSPQPGVFVSSVWDHYRSVVDEIKKSGMEPFVTLQHRTLPVWAAKQGGWLSARTVSDYVGYVKKSARELPQVKYWMPINEPIMSLAGGFLGGVYPPMHKSFFKALRAHKNMVRANNLAYTTIHQMIPGAAVGMPHAAVYADPYQNRIRNRILVGLIDYLANYKILKEAMYDFIGVQYYTRALVNLSFNGSLLPKVDQFAGPNLRSDLGWEIYPEGLYNFVKKIHKKFGKPIIVTENGIADYADSHRTLYIKEHLYWLNRAMAEGVDIRGYFYWALIDNMEWDKGFWPRFGLAEVDYKNFERKLRPSSAEYSRIIKNSGFDFDHKL